MKRHLQLRFYHFPQSFDRFTLNHNKIHIKYDTGLKGWQSHFILKIMSSFHVKWFSYMKCQKVLFFEILIEWMDFRNISNGMANFVIVQTHISKIKLTTFKLENSLIDFPVGLEPLIMEIYSSLPIYTHSHPLRKNRCGSFQNMSFK